MAEEEERPTIVQDMPEADPKDMPIYCLTKLTEEQKFTYTTAFASYDEADLDFVHPDFKAWTEDRDGDLQDMYRIWRETGNNESYHFAFFIDQQSLENTSIIIAQPDAYTMLYSESASQWAQANLSSYLNRKAFPEGVDPWAAPNGTYERWLEPLSDEILGKRGLSYGRVPASTFRSIWANLDIANMSMDEMVEMDGATVEIVENEDFDTDALMEKLDKIIREYIDNGGESE